MNRVFGAFVVVLLGSVVGYGQSLKAVGPTTPPGMSPLWGNCPVGLWAHRRGESNLVTVNGLERYEFSPRVHLMFDNWQPNAIVAMTVVVHGYDAKARISPAARGMEDSAELSKTVNLNLSVASGKKADADVTLRPLASVSRVDLELVEFSDGTRWSASDGKVCSVVPEMFMLVGSK